MSVPRVPRIVVLASGSGTNLQAILDQISAGQLSAQVSAVISDNPDAAALQRARSFGSAAHLIDFRQARNRNSYDKALEQVVLSLEPDLVVLAGYMRILCDSTVNALLGKMLNIHPSLLPAYPGLDTYRRVLEAGDSWHGTTVHFVTPELDAGPAVAQYRIKVTPDATEPGLRKRVQRGEYLIYPQVIDWFCRGRLVFKHNRVYMDQCPLRQPITVYESC